MNNTKNSNTKTSSKPKIIFVGDPDDVIDEPEKKPFSKKWAIIIAALVVILCVGFFAAASFAGIIQSFLTPESKQIKNIETSTETSSQEESTTEKETTTAAPTTTEEETTEEYIPSYYVIDVNLAYNQVIVYTRGERLGEGYDPDDPRDDVYDLIPVQAFSCSPGVDGATPTGRYELNDRSDWCFMVGDVYTQYATRITDAIMFHSVPYYTRDAGDLETYEYNILGYDASSGCIRLNCRDASWIFYNCAIGTEVNIYYDWGYSSPIPTNPIYHIPTDIDPLCKWDPTDDTYGNPWHSYSASLSADTISLPQGSSINYMLACLGPTDEYGNNLNEYFYTDGGYDLWTPGTYYTTGHIEIANLSFSFPITIIVTEEYADDYYENYYEEYGDNDDSEDDDWWDDDDYDYDDSDYDDSDYSYYEEDYDDSDYSEELYDYYEEY